MFCTKCGKEISDQAVVCVNCGCAVDSKFNLNKQQTNDTSKLYLILKYVSVALLALSIIFIFLSIAEGIVFISIGSYYADFLPNRELSLISLVFAVFAFVSSIINFIIGFKEENKKKRFSTDVIFIINMVIMVVSIICMQM